MKLQSKIILAFFSIVIVMVLFQSLFLQYRVNDNFENYIRQNEEAQLESWQEIVSGYYLYFGSFENIQDFLLDYQGDMRPRRGMMGRSNDNGFGNGYMFGPGMQSISLAVVNEEGEVVADTGGEWLGKEAESIPGVRESIVAEGEKVGELILYHEKTMTFYSIEKQFIDSMKSSIVYGAIFSIAIAFIISLFISNKITKPLEKLITGIQRLSKGDTSYRVKVHTKDEFHQLAEAFNDMVTKIEQNENVRRSLVADVAHELRTPLSILQGRLESIQEGTIEPSQEIILQLSDEVYRLTRLVSDLQQLSLAEAGKLELKKIETDIDALIHRIKMNFEWMAEEKGIELIYDSEDTPKLNIDSDRITQVIINILGNALRHTPANGQVMISTKTRVDRNSCMISIKDSGPGMEKEQLGYIFDRFYRTDSSRSRDQGGTGLGLSIAKSFVEAHGGAIQVESEKGKGTTFIIELPI